MTARTMFRAHLVVGSLEVPVRMYAAAQDAGIHFRLLHAEDRVPVEQLMVDPRTEEPVPPGSMQRGVEVEPGAFVVFTSEELEALTPPTERAMEVEGFIDRESLDLAWYDRPYYLGPDGPDRDYVALAAALAKRRQAAIVRWAMRKKRYVGAVLEEAGNLLLLTLHPAEDLALSPQLGDIEAKGDIDPKQVALAKQLVDTLAADFDLQSYEDDRRRRLESLLERKRTGEPIRLPRKPTTAPDSADLANVLRRSLRHAQEKRSA